MVPVRQQAQLRGFSLVELMFVLAISAILISIAVPSFTGTLERSKVSGTVNLFLDSVDLVRSEAIGRNRITVMCRTNDATANPSSCSTALSAGVPANDWGSGWLIYSKPSNATVPTAFDPATDTLIRRVIPSGAGTPGPRAVIEWATTTEFLAVGPQGTVVAPVGAPTVTVDYRLPSDPLDTNRTKCVSINLLARAAATALTGASC